MSPIPRTDSSGRLGLDGTDPTTMTAWAILQFGQVDPSLIFLRKHDAGSYAPWQVGDDDQIVPVLVNGMAVQRI